MRGLPSQLTDSERSCIAVRITRSMSSPLFDFLERIAGGVKNLSAAQLWDAVVNFPVHYEKWWMNLLHESPQHILIETSLIIFIIWLLFIRRTVDPKKSSDAPKLSQKEIDWLIETWEPEPLAPKVTGVEKLAADHLKVFNIYIECYCIA